MIAAEAPMAKVKATLAGSKQGSHGKGGSNDKWPSSKARRAKTG
jgi:hypothetical protein